MSTDPIARMERGLRITAWLWSIGVIITALGVMVLISNKIGGRDRVHLEQVLFTAWTLGPPCWFILQHQVWPPARDGQDRFQTHQALLTATWGGVVAFLAAITFGRWG